MMGRRRGGGGEKSSISLQDGGKEGEKRNDWGVGGGLIYSKLVLPTSGWRRIPV